MKWIPDPTLRSRNVEVPDEMTQPGSKNDAAEKVQGIERDSNDPSRGGFGSRERNRPADLEKVVEKPLPLPQVIIKLSGSSRALVALVISFVYGYVS
jgi:hypothetical protein